MNNHLLTTSVKAYPDRMRLCKRNVKAD